MTKLLGSLLVFAAGGMVWLYRLREGRRQRQLLAELAAALDAMETEIRLTRMPLPQLSEWLAGHSGGEVSALFRKTARGLKSGETPHAVWEQALMELPLTAEDRQTLLELSNALQGDETSACKGILLASKALRHRLEKREAQRPEEDKRATALCFSAAALVVILLI